MSPIKLGLWSAAVLALVPHRSALSQDSTSYLLGDREVRVTAPTMGFNKRRAIYRGVRDSALFIQLDTVVRVPFSAIQMVELLVGQRNNSGKGMKIGMVIGTAVGIAAGITAHSNCGAETEPEICRMWLLAGPAGGFGLGAIVGTILGGSHKEDVWRDVPVSSLAIGRSRFTREPQIGLSIKF